jgi:dCTP deaminase
LFFEPERLSFALIAPRGGRAKRSESADSLFPALPKQRSTGILPSQVIKELIRAREIQATAEISERQVQPASIDLRLATRAYRVRASFLPGEDATVERMIDRFGMHEIDLAGGAVLEKGCVYVVRLMEVLRLSSRISGIANPKSSTGRLDVFTRLITNNATEFDRVKSGYEGPLYAEISPRAFSILVRQGSRLNQMRFRRGSPTYSDESLRRLHEQVRLVHSDDAGENIAGGIAVSVDLAGRHADGLIGYRARKHTDVIDIDKVNHYDPIEFWEPVRARPGSGLILDPDDFHILGSKEPVTVPPDHAAEMVAYDTLVGEFRVHYAGFFDPGFGYHVGDAAGTRAVLEVRSHEVPFYVEDGQVVGRLIYEQLTDQPDRLYGPAIGSSYQTQMLALGKQFKL